MPRWGHRVAIPEPVHALCSHNVLTMEYLEGKKLVDGVRDYYSKQAQR